MSVWNIKMESKDKLKEADIKNRTCYSSDDKIGVIDIDFTNILLDEKSYKKIFWFMKFDTKILLVKSYCVFGLIK